MAALGSTSDKCTLSDTDLGFRIAVHGQEGALQRLLSRILLARSQRGERIRHSYCGAPAS